MRCEVCGKFIQGSPIHATIERANMLVCGGCANLASSTWGKTSRPQRISSPSKTRPLATRPASSRSLPAELDESVLVENYGAMIRNAREERGWTQERLGREINEKASIIGKLETQRIVPDMSLVRKLEHILSVSLLTDASKVVPRTAHSEVKPQELTVADVIVVRKREPRDVSRASNHS